MNSFRLGNLAFLALAPALFLAGCGTSEKLPTGTSSSGDPAADAASSVGLYNPPAPVKTPAGADLAAFYPLATGNRWHYQGLVTMRILGSPDAGSGDGSAPYTVVRNQTCPVTIDGRNYLTEHVTSTDPGGESSIWVRFRQDRHGLYEADQTGPDPSCEPVENVQRAPAGDPDQALSLAWSRAVAGVSDAARRASYGRAWEDLRTRVDAVRAVIATPARGLFGPPGATPEGELLRLRYPLAPGQHWIIRNSPRFEARVEGFDSLDLAAGRLGGWRIRYLNEFLGPDDAVHVWYGRKGYLQTVLHVESVATDEGGQPIGVVILDQSERLDGYVLVSPAGGPPAKQ